MSGSVLKPRGTSFASRLCDCCRGGCGYWFCHGTVLCYFRRPSFERVFSPRPRRPSIIRGHCEFGFCRGTVLRNPKRLRFIGGFCDCGRGTAPFNPRGPYFTDTNRLCDWCNGASPTDFATGVTALHQQTLRLFYRLSTKKTQNHQETL